MPEWPMAAKRSSISASSSCTPSRGAAMNIILGIDPGVVGGWAILNELGALIAVDDLPVAGDGAQRTIAAPQLASILGRYQPTTALVERVGAMPGQGVSSSFKFGRAVGVSTVFSAQPPAR
jgi:Holliday junction resolvasome RuvABC endonuclease subunit